MRHQAAQARLARRRGLRSGKAGTHARLQDKERRGNTEGAEGQRSEMQGVIHDSLQRRDALEGLTVEQLLEQRSSVVLLDVRPREEFDLGHLPGALNIPVTELRARMDELPRAVHIVAYCRGPYCVLSNDAVAMLREAGLTAQRLAAGYPEWKAAGLQVDLPRH